VCRAQRAHFRQGGVRRGLAEEIEGLARRLDRMDLGELTAEPFREFDAVAAERKVLGDARPKPNTLDEPHDRERRADHFAVVAKTDRRRRQHARSWATSKILNSSRRLRLDVIVAAASLRTTNLLVLPSPGKLQRTRQFSWIEPPLIGSKLSMTRFGLRSLSANHRCNRVVTAMSSMSTRSEL
jgi:hypothetical protein